MTGPVALLDVGRFKAEMAASSITRIEEDVEYDRARFREQIAAWHWRTQKANPSPRRQRHGGQVSELH